ncbi:hypothetical protein [Labilibaculum antarcticum]|nr:hypothetical protein [Labilibaculum antarcticum]
MPPWDINVAVSTGAGKENIWKAIRVCVGIAKDGSSKLDFRMVSNVTNFQ